MIIVCEAPVIVFRYMALYKWIIIIIIIFIFIIILRIALSVE